MTDTELLTGVKERLGITGTFQDNTLNGYIADVLEYLSDSGVSNTVLASESIMGVVARGVSDLWNYGSGGGKFSEYFYQRATQLSYYVETEDGGVTDV